jgi:hypothetical protein
MRFTIATAVATAVLCLAPPHPIVGQEPPAAPAAAAPQASASALEVFLDCNSFYCDFDFFRTEINWVNWVRDRQVADVHVLVSTQSTGAGGTEFTMAFIGLRTFAGAVDTLKYVSKPAATQDEVRRGLAQVLKTGLVRFVARTSAAERLRISFEGAEGQQAAKPQHDPWNFWVFRASMNGFGNGSSSNRFINGFGSFSANRVTEAWKTNLSLNGSYDESRFELSEGDRFTAIQRNYSVDALQVKSLGDHWSAGLTGGLFSSTYSNQKRVVRLSPAVEYDVFPYKESTRRQLRFQYSIGPVHYDYDDTTIYNKVKETRVQQSATISLSMRQPWGTVSVSGSHRDFVNDPTQRNESIGGSISWRIVKGLNFNIGGNYSQVHDQIYLPKAGATDQEILVRVQELSTNYRYFVNFGLSYTFGSIFNNVVNPRFGSDGGFFFFD